jgi:hypothetical protein
MAELSGSWIYRSFNPTFVTGNETPQEDALIAGQLDLTLSLAPPSTTGPMAEIGAPEPVGLVGMIGWRGTPPGVLDVNGTIDPSPGREHQRFDFTATGRRDTATAGWQYDYHGHMGRNWAMPDGSTVDRHPTLVGSVIRVTPHNGRPGGAWQSRAGEVLSFIAVKPQQADMPHNYDLMGEWTYQSFHNDTTYPYLTARPNGLILQEALLKLETTLERGITTLRGTMEWSGRVLDIRGQLFASPLESGQPQEFIFSATGRPDTATAGWKYEYHGDMTRTWRNGDKQVPALVGSGIREKAHGDSPAGYVAPFIAVKQ